MIIKQKHIEVITQYNKKSILDSWTNYTVHIKHNKNNPFIFKDNRINNGKAYNLYSIIWNDISNNIFFVDKIVDVFNNKYDSRMYIKDFPFLPKTFIIKIFKDNSNKYKIIDNQLLLEVYKIYDLIDEEWVI
jgi:hypothetical protein